jgi:predicted metalloprotease with PDZ domain
MLRPTTVLLALTILPAAAVAQIQYDVRFPNAVHHEAEITVSFDNLPAGPLELRMSRSSPGRYALHEFAKNVYSVRVTGPSGETLAVERPNPYQWDVPNHGAKVTVTYTLFADRAGGTYSQVDRTHAHLNMPATFMWARHLDDRRIAIAFHPPEGSQWKAATQLFPSADAMQFTAPNLQYFMDSPTELSDFTLREWPVQSKGRSYTFRMAVHHLGTEAEVDDYVEMAKKVVQQEIAVFGETAPYDTGTYTFIADYLPWASGDGMEHRNSTVIVSTGSLARNALGLLGTVSHEFFHSWNVERIRPASLEPFDFEHANMSRELWFAEGFTSYYTPLFLRRAELIDTPEYARRISGGLSYVINAPGRRFFSPVEMSMQAPFVDAATAIDPTNLANTFISYYTWGSVLGLGLDLTLRSRFGTDLDTYMRAMWESYGKPEIPYRLQDLRATLAHLTGDQAFADDFFDRFVEGRDVPDYESLLANAGFLFRKAAPNQAFMGDPQLSFDASGATLRSGTIIGTPLYDAGLDRGDRITALDGRPITSADDLQAVLRSHPPGDVIPVEFVQREAAKTASLTLVVDPSLEVVPYEDAGLEVTDAMRQFREAWLGKRS